MKKASASLICKVSSSLSDRHSRPNSCSVQEIVKTESSLTLRITPTSWEDSFHHVNVHFGNDLKIEPLQPLKKRQAAVNTVASAAFATAASAAASASLSFPAANASLSFPAANASLSFPAAPTTTATITAVRQASINDFWNDTAIVPPSFPGVDSSSLIGPNSPAGLTVNCKNCYLQGSIDLSSANLSAGNSNDTGTEVISFIEDGTFELALNDFAVHMELESTVQLSASKEIIKAPFPDIPLTPFYIPRIATIGPVLRPAVSIGVQVSTQLEFSYGFDLKLPGPASITLDLGNPGSSRVVGFNSTRLSALPFQAQIDNINLTVSVGFSPELLLTAKVLNQLGQIDAGAFLDLPLLKATISQVDHVDDKCNSINTTDTYKDFLSNSLTNIVPSVDLGVGVLADVEVDISKKRIKDTDARTTIYSTQYALPTACLSFDKAKKTYGPAAAAAAAATTAAAYGGPGSSGAEALRYDERVLRATLLLSLLLAGLDHV